MKQLFWKEWHELRLLPLGAALLFLIWTLFFYTMCRMNVADVHPSDFSVDSLLPQLWVLWSLFAILAGAGLFSQEVGAGTLGFLLSLPRSRPALWLVKAAAGLVGLLASAVCSSLVLLIVAKSYAQVVPDAFSFSKLFTTTSGYALLISVGCFAVAMTISPLVDRYVSAALISLLTCLFLAIATLLPASAWGFQFGDAAQIAWLFIPAFGLISYATFTRGESLRANTRFYVAGVSAAACLVVIVGIVTMVILVLMPAQRVHAEDWISARELVVPRESYVALPWSDGTARARFNPVPRSGKLYACEQAIVDGKALTGGMLFDLTGKKGMVEITAHLKVLNADLPTGADPYKVPVSTPRNTRFSLQLACGDKHSAPVYFTLPFKSGAGAFDYSTSPSHINTFAAMVSEPAILDEVFIDKSLSNVPTRWLAYRNNAAFTLHYPPNTVHRITVRVTFSKEKSH